MTKQPQANVVLDTTGTATNTVFVLVPGAWHTTEYLEPTRDYLREMGYDSVSVSHQTLDPINPGTSVLDDAAKLERVVNEVLIAGKNVVVVMHSYGGFVGSQAIGHLLSTIKSTPSSSDHDKAGVMGKVLRLVYVAALIPQAGETSAALGELVLADSASKEGLPIDLVDGKMVCKEEIKELFYGDLPESDRDKYYNLLQAWPAGVDTPDASTHFGWKYVPSTYIHATNDWVVSLKAQIRMLARTNNVLSLQSGGLMVDREASTATKISFKNKDCEGQDPSLVQDAVTVKLIESDHCSMFILRKHVKLLGRMLIESAEPEKVSGSE